MIKRLIEFIKYGIWQGGDSSGRKVRWYIKPFKIVIVTAKGFIEHNLVVRSAAMTFYTLVSIVPIAALIFAIVKGFGVDTNFNDYLYMKFPEYAPIIDKIIDFAQNLLEKTRGGVIASVGLVVLLWAVMRLFGNMESSFNTIWEIKKNRSFARKFSDYIAVVFIAPLLWVASNSLALYIENTLSLYTSSWFVELLYGIGSLVIMWLMFTFIYYVMPNTKVKIKSAFVAGVVAGTFFSAFQLGYVWVQSSVSNYNAIYGSFAALPLFLIFVQTSWQILLFGGELSFAHQNLGRYEQERDALHMSIDHRRKVLMATMVTIVKHFIEKKGPVNSEEVAAELELPLRIVRDVMYELDSADLIIAVRNESNDKDDYYIPAMDVHVVTVFDIIDAVEKTGKSTINVDDSVQMEKVYRILEDFKQKAYTSPLNVRLTELI